MISRSSSRGGVPSASTAPLSTPFHRRSLPASNAAHRTSVPRIRTGVRTALGPRLPAVRFLSRSAIRSDGFGFYFVLNLIFPHRCSDCFVYRFIFLLATHSCSLCTTIRQGKNESSLIFLLVLMDIVLTTTREYIQVALDLFASLQKRH